MNWDSASLNSIVVGPLYSSLSFAFLLNTCTVLNANVALSASMCEMASKQIKLMCGKHSCCKMAAANPSNWLSGAWSSEGVELLKKRNLVMHIQHVALANPHGIISHELLTACIWKAQERWRCKFHAYLFELQERQSILLQPLPWLHFQALISTALKMNRN